MGPEDEIDLVELTHIIWNARIIIAKITGVFLILGLLVAFLSPVQYQADAKLIPESQSQQGGASSLLQQYGGLLGISGASNFGNGGVISPQLYPEVVNSLPYQIELMSIELNFSEYDTVASAFEFYNDIYSPSFLTYVKNYTIGLPGKIASMFSDKTEETPVNITNTDSNSILSLTGTEMGIVNTLRSVITINISQETGVITFSAEMPDPKAAAELSHSGILLLKEHVKEYRTQKAQQNLEFVQTQLTEARKRFEEVQQNLAEFRDSNINIATAKAKTREQELQSKYDLTFDLYNTLAQRLEQAKLTLQEETPVLTVLQPVSVPLKKSSPNRLLIFIASGFLGIIISLSWVMFIEWWTRVKYSF